MSKKSNFHPCLLTGYINVFVVMWQDAKEIITRRMRAIAGSFTFPPLSVSSQTKRAYYMLKKRLQIVCEDTNEGSEVLKT